MLMASALAGWAAHLSAEARVGAQQPLERLDLTVAVFALAFLALPAAVLAFVVVGPGRRGRGFCGELALQFGQDVVRVRCRRRRRCCC